MIGLADVTNGRLISFIDNHRQACAKHDVTPDLITYRRGHAEGLIDHCKESNRYMLGKVGDAYKGVCPPNLTEDFMTGYRVGKRFYTIAQDIKQAESGIKSSQNQIKEAELERLM